VNLHPPVTVRRPASPEELARAFTLRHEVFVDEQRVPVELERDEHDATAVHAVAVSAAGEVLATGRLVALDGRTGKVGRMAVARAHRGAGYGARVLAFLEAAAVAEGLAEILLHAQTSARGFYDRAGYAAHGPLFEEAGIEHVEMRKALRPGPLGR
jgi:predicted GNAT family N-acyltransferase